MEQINEDQINEEAETTPGNSSPIIEMAPVESPQAYYRPPYIGRAY